MSLSTRSVAVKQDVDQTSVIPPSITNQVPKFSVSNVLNDQLVTINSIININFVTINSIIIITINSIIIICYYK